MALHEVSCSVILQKRGPSNGKLRSKKKDISLSYGVMNWTFAMHPHFFIS